MAAGTAKNALFRTATRVWYLPRETGGSDSDAFLERLDAPHARSLHVPTCRTCKGGAA